MRQFTVRTLRDALERVETQHGDMPIVIEGGGYDGADYQLIVDCLHFEGDRLCIEVGCRYPEESERKRPT